MKFLFAIMSVLFTVSSFAACPKQAKEAFSSYKKSQLITRDSYSSYSVALKHYRNSDSLEGAGQPSIESIDTYIKGNRVSGYRVDISDGGDESTVSYVFNAERKLVVAYWHNEYPITFWFCGKNTVVETEETATTPRI